MQICTAVMQYGYRIIDDLIDGLQNYMYSKNINNLDEICGRALENIVSPEELDRDTILYPKINKQDCVKCGRCFISCQDGGHQAIKWSENRCPEINQDKCVGCHLCALVCPASAITPDEKRIKSFNQS